MSITIEGQRVDGALENILTLAAEHPERFGLDRLECREDFTREEVSTVLSRVPSNSNLLLLAPSGTGKTFFRREIVSDAREDRCDELGSRLRNRGLAGLAEFLGIGFPGGGRGIFLGTVMMVPPAETVSDLMDYVNGGCLNP